MRQVRESRWEVYTYEAVIKHRVRLTNQVTGEVAYGQVIDWEWRNSFCATVTFMFRGQKFTVLGEVAPDYGYFI